MNRLWHQQHVLGKNASLEERMAWHSEHQVACACRPIPAQLLAQMSVSGAAPARSKVPSGASTSRKGGGEPSVNTLTRKPATRKPATRSPATRRSARPATKR